MVTASITRFDMRRRGTRLHTGTIDMREVERALAGRGHPIALSKVFGRIATALGGEGEHPTSPPVRAAVAA